MRPRHVLCCAATALAWRLSAQEPPLFVTVAQHDVSRAPFAARSIDVSADGRYVAFDSYARLVPADVNDYRDVYVLDRFTGRVTLEPETLESHYDRANPRISRDGRRLVFEARSAAAEVGTDIILSDRTTSAATVLTKGIGGAAADGWSRGPDISDDGRFVAFASTATNLVPGRDANGTAEDVYLLEVETGKLDRVSLDNHDVESPSGASFSPSVSSDGRTVAFTSTALLAPAPSAPRSPVAQIYVRDAARRTTTRVTGGDSSRIPDGRSSYPALSGDARYVAFVSEATNLVANDRNGAPDVFLYDRRAGVISLVSRGADGASANGASTNPMLAHDGRFVAFQSDASNLVCAKRCAPGFEDINLLWDVFVLDRETGQITRASGDGTDGWMEPSIGPAIDASASTLAFSSRHPTDVFDSRDDFDLFVRSPRPVATNRRGR
jgi:Tol biopolymer transport system component